MMVIKDYRSAFAALGILFSTAATHAQSVSILEGNTPTEISVTQTQTQITPGLKIVDYQMPSKTQRYLWGQHAKDTPLDGGRRPKFVIRTDSLLLCDMVLVKLKTRREYRLIPKADIHDCPKTFCDLNNFSIEPFNDNVKDDDNVNDNNGGNDDAFVVQPLKDLAPGEYVITWLTAPTIGKYSDWKVWPFSIR